jgi:small neutral amino acid transporter SnatA (MarC family)
VIQAFFNKKVNNKTESFMGSTGQIIATIILGLIAFGCLMWTFYHLDTFTSNIFGSLLILVVGVICGIIACAESGIIGGSSET